MASSSGSGGSAARRSASASTAGGNSSGTSNSARIAAKSGPPSAAAGQRGRRIGAADGTDTFASLAEAGGLRGSTWNLRFPSRVARSPGRSPDPDVLHALDA